MFHIIPKQSFSIRPILVVFTLIVGCQNPEFYAFADASNLPPLDSASIKKGRLENLDDLKGIDNWRLGMPKKYYKNAFYTDSAYRTDTCKADITNRSFREDVHATLTFKSDTLSTIILYLHSHNIRSLIRRLCDLYGEPNQIPFRFDVMADSMLIFQQTAPEKERKTYKEDPKDVFDSVISYNGPDLPLYRNNIMHISDYREKGWPDTTGFLPATVFDYYPDMKIWASWKSKRSLEMKIFRKASVTRLNGEDTARHVMHIDYYVILEMK